LAKKVGVKKGLKSSPGALRVNLLLYLGMLKRKRFMVLKKSITERRQERGIGPRTILSGALLVLRYLPALGSSVKLMCADFYFPSSRHPWKSKLYKRRFD